MFTSPSLYKDYTRFIEGENSEASSSSESNKEDKQEIRNLKRANLDLQEKLLETKARLEASQNSMLQTQQQLDNNLKGISYAKAIDGKDHTSQDINGEILFRILDKMNLMEDSYKNLEEDCREIKDLLIQHNTTPKQDWVDAISFMTGNKLGDTFVEYGIIDRLKEEQEGDGSTRAEGPGIILTDTEINTDDL